MQRAVRDYMKTIGIYYIRNLASNKTYFGQSTDVKSRLSHHRYMLKNKLHFCSDLQAAYDQNGKDGLEFGVLATCLKNELDIFEKWAFSLVSDEFRYNIRPAGKCGFHHTKETKEKMRKSKLGRKLTEGHKIKIGNSGRGIIRSEESKKNIADGTKASWDKTRLQRSKGYSFERNKWRARIIYKGKKIDLGCWHTEEQARQAYLDALLQLNIN